MSTLFVKVLDFGGNLFDTMMIGVRAALSNTKLFNIYLLVF